VGGASAAAVLRRPDAEAIRRLVRELTPLLLEFEVAGEASAEIFSLFGDVWCVNLDPPE
jgi:hypothetical protein